MATANRSERVPKKMRAQYDGIVALTDEVCAKHLNAGFAQLARKATAALARKRPSPLEHGRANTWGCGIVFALCEVNFGFSEGQSFAISPEDLIAAFGVAMRTAQARAKTVREALKMGPFDPEWYVTAQMVEDPLAWYITVQGKAVDARQMPREVQEIAFEKGLIPYLPD